MAGLPVSSRSLRAHLLLTAVVLVWGATFVMVKGALRDISPLLFNVLRMLLATGTLALLYRRQLRGLARDTVAAGAVAGLCLAIGFQFQTAGLARTTPAKSAFITGLTVVLVPLLSSIPGLRAPGVHRPGANALVGAALAFIGILLLTTPPHTPWRALFGSITLGDALTFICALGFALHVLALAHFSPRTSLGPLAVLQVAFCSGIMATSLPFFEHPYIHVSPRLIGALLIAALLATAAAFTIQSWAQQVLPATHTALIFALEPVFAAITSFLVVGERLSGRSGAGAGLILLGIAITEFFPTGDVRPTAPEAL